ncbi:MAG: MotA/TolQ/ExbB proton channel family protein [bacterium]|uniref:MotA/TolQ/ExbB proton channel family protein n=1 Tax=Candidatus Aphodosoma intestinipullorum TaxID=2840674 RepID=A0A940DM42_9BACT|nr:MotA/TolQ/ExbB proton channel family protein [Candidatus Aphodosoma intestinipullorum]
MKKVFAMMTIVAFLGCGVAANVMAQESTPAVPAADSAQVDSSAAAPAPAVIEEAETVVEEEVSMHKALKTKFIEGDAMWMAPVAFCLIFGLAICIERIIYLNLATINSKKLINKIDEAWGKGGVEAAIDVCRNTRGPIASIFYQGLSRHSEGVDVVEKTVASYGSVQLGLLEKNISWISLFIALAPMFGFMGTVVGMIQAFDRIQQAGDISATIVAGGIKVALLTTVFGLIVAIILQLFYNYILSRIEALVSDMEDSSISLLDVVVKYSK